MQVLDMEVIRNNDCLLRFKIIGSKFKNNLSSYGKLT